MENLDYNEKYRRRTKKYAVDIIRFYTQNCTKNEVMRILGKQLLRSGTSVAANFRAYTRGRSIAERYSKMCIVVEEADETQFWLEIIEEAELLPFDNLSTLKNETEELVKIFTKTKASVKK
ncbi:MAG TPA: four helix bundle protein [Paludibacteraceae bacterium]|nr:four helix bundle protein [Paludibacteraceae bacterium]